MKNPSTGVLLGIVAFGLFVFHAWVIADDVWVVIEDPNQTNNRAKF